MVDREVREPQNFGVSAVPSQLSIHKPGRVSPMVTSQPLHQLVFFSLGGLICMTVVSILRPRLRSPTSWTMSTKMTSSCSSTLRQSTHIELPSLLNIDIDTVSDGLALGHFTSVDLVKTYLARIEEATYFKAVLQINPNALTAAQDLDDERVRLKSRGYVRYCFLFW